MGTSHSSGDEMLDASVHSILADNSNSISDVASDFLFRSGVWTAAESSHYPGSESNNNNENIHSPTASPRPASSEEDFLPVPCHEWQSRSIETLILGQTSVAPMLAQPTTTTTSTGSPSSTTRTQEDALDDLNSFSLHHGDHLGTSSQLTGLLGDDSSSHTYDRRNSLTNIHRWQSRSNLDFGIPQRGGTLANYRSSANSSNGQFPVRYRRRTTTPQSPPAGKPPNAVLSLLAREVTGHVSRAAPTMASRLEQVGGTCFIKKVDQPAAGMMEQVERLRKAVNVTYDWTETQTIVSKLTPRLMGDPTRSNQASATVQDANLPPTASPHYAGGGRLGLERDAFVVAGGVSLYLQIFAHSIFCGTSPNGDARNLSKNLVVNKLQQCFNEMLASLRELVYALPVLVHDGTILQNGDFLPFLFTLLSHEVCFETTAALIEEILSLLSHIPPPSPPPDEALIDTEFRCRALLVPATTFFLGNVPDLYSLWRGFKCRHLAHFCRILALLVFDCEDRQLLESPSVLKSLELLQLRRDRAARAGRDATVDMNQAILLGDSMLMQRLLKLLKIFNYAPTLKRTAPYHVMAHYPFVAETLGMLGLTEFDSWNIERMDSLAKTLMYNQDGDKVKEVSELGSVASMLESLATLLQNSNREPVHHLGHIIHVVNAAQQAGIVVGHNRNNNNNNNNSNNRATERARQRQERHREGRRGRNTVSSSIHVSSVPLDSSGLMPYSNDDDDDDDDIDDAEDDDVAAEEEVYSSHRINAPEDAANEMQFNSLLLAPYQVEVLFVLCTLMGGRRKIDAQRFLGEHDLITTMDEMFHRLSWGDRTPPPSAAAAPPQDQEESQAGIHGPGCECTPESALSVQYLRVVHNFCDRDCDNYYARRLLLSKEELEYVFSDQVWTDTHNPPNLNTGLFSKIVAAFTRQADDSQFRFWLASCAEAHLRGSSPQEQLFAAKSGLLRNLLDEIVSDRLHCAGSLQTSFDLLGEVCKGNTEVLRRLVSNLDEESFRKLMSGAASNLVDSNVFLRSILLTVERISAKTLFPSGIRNPSDPWATYKNGPWTGPSGHDTRYFLTHSWWDSNIPPRSSITERTEPTEAYDNARTSDWFPPDYRVNQSTLLGDHNAESSLSFDACIGYNGWLFSPSPTHLLSPAANDPFGWALGEQACMPNTIERLAWFLITNQTRLLRDLLLVVDLRNINHENICCLNTAVVFSMFAGRRNQLEGVLQELRRMSDEERQAPSVSDAMNKLDIAADAPKRPSKNQLYSIGDRSNLLRNFRELLWFWSEYYTHRGRDRLSLEFSSHLRFQDWYTVVSALTSDDAETSTSLVNRSVRLPRSPYQRAARVLDNPRRS